MNETLGLEALTQRGPTPLFKDLTLLVNESFDNLRPPLNDHNVYVHLTGMGFGDKLKEIVAKHMTQSGKSQVLTHVVFINSPDVNMAIQIYPLRPDGLTGLESKSQSAALAAISGRYDSTSGKLADFRKGEMAIGFRFLITTAWWRSWSGEIPTFTAEEIASVLIHELGHVWETVEAFKRMVTPLTMAADQIVDVNVQPNRDAIMALLEVVKSSPTLDKSWRPVVTLVDQYFQTHNDLTDPAFLESLSVLSALVAAEYAGEFRQDIQNYLGTTDLVTTNFTRSNSERTADDFVARNGALSAWVSLRAKSTKLDTSDSKLLISLELGSVAATLLSTLIWFGTLFYYPMDSLSSGYDPVLRRMELAIETTKHAFHDSSLPDDVKAELHHQIEQAEKDMASFNSTTHRAIKNQITLWKKNMSGFGRILASPFQNRLTQDYARLQQETRGLSRHPLYHLHDKL